MTLDLFNKTKMNSITIKIFTKETSQILEVTKQWQKIFPSLGDMDLQISIINDFGNSDELENYDILFDPTIYIIFPDGNEMRFVGKQYLKNHFAFLLLNLAKNQSEKFDAQEKIKILETSLKDSELLIKNIADNLPVVFSFMTLIKT